MTHQDEPCPAQPSRPTSPSFGHSLVFLVTSQAKRGPRDHQFCFFVKNGSEKEGWPPTLETKLGAKKLMPPGQKNTTRA